MQKATQQKADELLQLISNLLIAYSSSHPGSILYHTKNSILYSEDKIM